MRLPRLSLKKAWPFHLRRSSIFSRGSASSTNSRPQPMDSNHISSTTAPYTISDCKMMDCSLTAAATTPSCTAGDNHRSNGNDRMMMNHYTTAARTSGIVLGVPALRNAATQSATPKAINGSSSSGISTGVVRDMNHEKFQPCVRRAKSSFRGEHGATTTDAGADDDDADDDDVIAAIPADQRRHHQIQQHENVVRKCNQRSAPGAKPNARLLPSIPLQHHHVQRRDAAIVDAGTDASPAAAASLPLSSMSSSAPPFVHAANAVVVAPCNCSSDDIIPNAAAAIANDPRVVCRRQQQGIHATTTTTTPHSTVCCTFEAPPRRRRWRRRCRPPPPPPPTALLPPTVPRRSSAHLLARRTAAAATTSGGGIAVSMESLAEGGDYSLPAVGAVPFLQTDIVEGPVSMGCFDGDGGGDAMQLDEGCFADEGAGYCSLEWDTQMRCTGAAAAASQPVRPSFPPRTVDEQHAAQRPPQSILDSNCRATNEVVRQHETATPPPPSPPTAAGHDNTATEHRNVDDIPMSAVVATPHQTPPSQRRRQVSAAKHASAASSDVAEALDDGGGGGGKRRRLLTDEPRTVEATMAAGCAETFTVGGSISSAAPLNGYPNNELSAAESSERERQEQEEKEEEEDAPSTMDCHHDDVDGGDGNDDDGPIDAADGKRRHSSSSSPARCTLMVGNGADNMSISTVVVAQRQDDDGNGDGAADGKSTRSTRSIWDADEDDDGYLNDCGLFTVRITRSSRGLGFAIGDTAAASGLIRIRRLFPHLVAWSSGRLRPGDILLAANEIALSGLTTAEALDVLRSLKDEVTLHVCRTSDENHLQQILAKHGAGLNWRPQTEAPLPPIKTLDVHLRKSHGSLGFTLRKETESRRCRHGHHISALVREPATTDGRLRVGDQIVAVNGVPIGRLSHEEAVMVLRAADEAMPVRLQLCRPQDDAKEDVTEKTDAQQKISVAEDGKPTAKHTLRAHAVRRLNALADRSKVFCYEDVVTAC